MHIACPPGNGRLAVQKAFAAACVASIMALAFSPFKKRYQARTASPPSCSIAVFGSQTDEQSKYPAIGVATLSRIFTAFHVPFFIASFVLVLMISAPCSHVSTQILSGASSFSSTKRLADNFTRLSFCYGKHQACKHKIWFLFGGSDCWTAIFQRIYEDGEIYSIKTPAALLIW